MGARRASALIALILLVAGCGLATDPAAGPAVTPAPQVTRAPQLAEPSGALVAASADGEVTAGELEAAYQAYVGCLVSRGASGEYAYDLSIGPGIGLSINVEGDGPEGVLTDRALFFCEQRHVGDLEGIYWEQHPPGAEADARGLETMRACLEEIGIALPGESVEELVAAIDRATWAQVAVGISRCRDVGRIGRWRPLG